MNSNQLALMTLRSSALVFFLGVSFASHGAQSRAGILPTEGNGPASEASDSFKGGVIIDGLQLAARADKETVELADPVVLHVVLKNVAGLSYSIAPNIFASREDLEVVNEKGEKVRLTAYGGNVIRWMTAGAIFASGPTLQAGTEIRLRLLVNSIYDMTEPGRYSIRVKDVFRKRNAPPGAPNSSFTLLSNPVNIEVRKAQSPVVEDVSTTDRVSTPGASSSPGVSGPPSRIDKSPTTLWHVGDAWQLSVELWTAAGGIRPSVTRDNEKYILVGQYPMQVKVVASENVDGHDAWMVDFIPVRRAPSTVGGELFRVWVGQEDGVAKRIVSLKKTFNPPLQGFKGIALPGGSTLGFPLEFLPLTGAPLEDHMGNGYMFSFSTEASPATAVALAKLRVGDADRFVIKETWLTGAKWWSEYEKQDFNQHIILKAKQVPNE